MSWPRTEKSQSSIESILIMESNFWLVSINGLLYGTRMRPFIHRIDECRINSFPFNRVIVDARKHIRLFMSFEVVSHPSIEWKSEIIWWCIMCGFISLMMCSHSTHKHALISSKTDIIISNAHIWNGAHSYVRRNIYWLFPSPATVRMSDLVPISLVIKWIKWDRLWRRVSSPSVHRHTNIKTVSVYGRELFNACTYVREWWP